MARSTEQARPLDGADLLLLDLDGVVYAGSAPIPHAVDSINRAQQAVRVAYLTNNASRTDATVAAQLTELGLRVSPDEIVTSPQAAVTVLAEQVPEGSMVLVVGGEGLTSELEKAGFTVTRSAEDGPAAVVQGFHPSVAWTDLAEASYALRADPTMPWIATNTDWTIPQTRGIAPGNGTLVSAVHTVVGRLPVVAGKPERAIFDAAVARFGGDHPLFVGDRLDTDIVGANRAGQTSALVMTGIDGPKQVLAAEKDSRPHYLLADLRDLFQPYPAPTVEQKRGTTRIRSGRAVVTVADDAVRLERASEPIEILRAAAAAIWGTGKPIYALDVAAELYSWS
ncbi:HAD hydrolase-like protein [Pseudolysinimonas kribbensis]|uniref:Haloacid dehalogenase n=1 Tax=Pseudolysinimonas kribbensis TaxID=433641 RepID=A0ABQ6K351_9MICO|nr:HAD-IIA family hydrolase [Pseudolysinimonas kribbensis]GMA93505.1 haloacid dehalogenase [Pseudolysinimonas kribbensis]